MAVDAEQVLAFRLARSGLASRSAGDLAEAAACPAADPAPDAALLALGARSETVTRARYAEAVDGGALVVAYVLRGAIHAVAPGDHGLLGRALVAAGDDEAAAQLGAQVQRLAAEKGFSPRAALDEVAAAVGDALAGGRALDKQELHAELRARVHADLMPWCRGCESFHVAPMLWRYGTVVAGARLDASRRYVLDDVAPSPDPSAAVRRFLHCYGPAGPSEFADWAGVAKAHARRLWDPVAGELTEVPFGRRGSFVLRADAPVLESPPAAAGIRFLPPSDPYLWKPNRPLLAPDPELRKRLFRPVAGPGAVLRDGRLAGLWRARLQRRSLALAIEPVAPLRAAELGDEARRVAELRGAADVTVTLT